MGRLCFRRRFVRECLGVRGIPQKHPGTGGPQNGDCRGWVANEDDVFCVIRWCSILDVKTVWMKDDLLSSPEKVAREG